MNITRHNYEEYFLLYIDNELSIADGKAVEEFVSQNPDLKEELVMLQQSLFRPDKNIVFDHKDALLQPVVNQSGINSANYETFFVLYGDNELSNREKAAVEDFVYRNPQFQHEFELLQQVRLEPDNSVVFVNKESLYRKEEDEKVVPIIWWRWVAAAIVLIIAGVFWITAGSKKKDNDFARDIPAKQNSTAPAPAIRKADDAVNQQKENTAPQNMATVDEQEKKEDLKTDKPGKAAEGPSIIKKEQQQLAVKKQGPVKQPGKEETAVKEQEPLVAQVDEKTDNLKGSSVTASTNKNEKQQIAVGISDGPDTPTIFINPEKNNNSQAYLTSSGDDNIEVLNTTVNKQNSLRGFFRKASRLIAKKTNLGDGDGDGNRKGILIGGFEIAVK
jgi:hypothetical protein